MQVMGDLLAAPSKKFRKGAIGMYSIFISPLPNEKCGVERCRNKHHWQAKIEDEVL